MWPVIEQQFFRFWYSVAQMEGILTQMFAQQTGPKDWYWRKLLFIVASQGLNSVVHYFISLGLLASWCVHDLSQTDV